MPTKFVYFFNGGRNGWTETWYATYDAADLDSLANIAEGVGILRRRMLAKNFAIDAIRVSDPDIRGLSFLKRLTDGGGLAPGGSLVRDVKQQSMLLTCRSSEGLVKRPVLLRGCPDEWFNYDVGREDPPGVFFEAMKGWGTALRNRNFAIRAIARSLGTGAEPIRRIEAVNLDGTIHEGHISIRVGGHGLRAGRDVVRIRGARFVGSDPPKINGVWRVLIGTEGHVDEGDWFSIDLPGSPVLAANCRYFTGGKVQRRSVAYLLVDVAPIKFERYTQRATGKAFFSGRGRSRAVRR